MENLSVVIITFNEERNIVRCLDSVKEIADDIVIVDSFSTDKTKEICTSYSVNFISHLWEGYSATKNFANQQAKYNWIFSIDADEAISEELKDAILKAKFKGDKKNYTINRITNYCGHWVKYGGWHPDVKWRFFDRTNTRWEGLIHEELYSKTIEKQALLKGDCYHYSYYNKEQHLQQADKFSTLVAKDFFEKGKKSSMLKLFFSPIIKFLKDYLFRFGFLDGATGFVIARISAHATFQKYYKLKLLYKQNSIV